MNLFRKTQKLTNGRYEDHLTEFFAAGIAMSQSFRIGVSKLLLAKYHDPTATIIDVETQVSYPGINPDSGCQPDMQLHLSNGKCLLVENKIEASENIGNEIDPRPQIERYLDLDCDGVIYVRAALKPPTDKALLHPKYIRHPSREHFLWRDFYDLLKAENSPYFSWMAEAFEKMGYTPPHTSFGEMNGDKPEENARNRQNFQKLWGLTASLAKEFGWKVEANKNAELYLYDHPDSLIWQIFVSPAVLTRFAVKITPRPEADSVAERMVNMASTEIHGMGIEHDLLEGKGLCKNTPVKTFNLVTSLSEVMGKEEVTPEEADKKLLSFMTPIIRNVR